MTRLVRLLLLLLIAETLLLGGLCAAWQAQRAADHLRWCTSYTALQVQECAVMRRFGG